MKVLCIDDNLYSPTCNVKPIIKAGCVFYVHTIIENEFGICYILCEQREIWYVERLFIPCSYIDEREWVNKKELCF